MKKSVAVSIGLFALAASLAFGQGMKKDSNGMGSDGGAMMAADPSKAVFNLSGMAPGVLPFSSEESAQAIAARRKVVYFFAASWCPYCREAYRDLKANAASVPKDLTIIVVDYDKSTGLKMKYGVTSQHTFVSIGPKGENLKIWSGSTTLEDIVRNASLM